MSDKRMAHIKRHTKETNISCKMALDGSGKHEIQTGIPFFDHMLEQLSQHSLIDLVLLAKGDLHIDQHHTVEDVGLVMGQTFRKALGDARGITRFSHTMLPMDETLTTTSLDISGRPFLLWKVKIPASRVGTLDTELIHEWFRAFVQEARITVHVHTPYGANTHHIVESCYKSLALALRKALKVEKNLLGKIPSTKGKLDTTSTIDD